MPCAFVPFTGWTPSAGTYFGEGWSTAENLVPLYDAHCPARGFDALDGSGLPTVAISGSYTHLWMSGAPGAGSYLPDAVTLFAGTTTKLYSVAVGSGNFTDLSKGGGYGATPPACWRGASVGNDVWMTNWLDPLQRRTNNTGNFADGVTSSFAPKPRFIATVREHLAGANLSNAGRFQDEIVWSDADNALNFDPPTGTSTSLAGSKRLVSIPGQITGLVGGQYLLAFKRRCIYYLEYTGSTQIFRPDILSESIGTAYPSSIITSRYGVFFFGLDGFYQISGLGQPVKISTPGVDYSVLGGALSALGSGFTAQQEDWQMHGFQSSQIPLVGWAYRTSTTLSGGNTKWLFYNPVAQRWTSSDTHPVGAAELWSLADLPFGTSVFDTIAGFTFDGSQSRLATWPAAVSGESPALGATLSLRYRPAFLDSVNEFQQSTIRGVQPLFSKTSPSGAALSPSVTVTPLYDPHGSPGTAETRVAADRNIAGFYPFQIAGRYFQISIACAQGEDFANFEGVWIDSEVLR